MWTPGAAATAVPALAPGSVCGAGGLFPALAAPGRGRGGIPARPHCEAGTRSTPRLGAWDGGGKEAEAITTTARQPREAVEGGAGRKARRVRAGPIVQESEIMHTRVGNGGAYSERDAGAVDSMCILACVKAAMSRKMNPKSSQIQSSAAIWTSRQIIFRFARSFSSLVKIPVSCVDESGKAFSVESWQPSAVSSGSSCSTVPSKSPLGAFKG